MIDNAPGWAAIDAALDRIYAGVPPHHLATIVKWALGGPDPLDGVSIYPRSDHWHLVTYGMSELYEKESEDPDVSGCGFEFTLRVARRPGDLEPVWAANLLQNLARYVFQSGNSFEAGHHMDLNGPISLERPDTAIRAIAFTADPELAPIDTPHGRLEFLQVVGLTMDEYAACQAWDTAKVLDELALRMPLFITDLDRDSGLAAPDVAAAVERGTRRDGSATGSLYVAESHWSRTGDRTVLRFGANAARHIASVLSGRLAHGRGLAIAGPEQQILLRPADNGVSVNVAEITEDTIEVTLGPQAVVDLCAAIRPVAGVYPLPTAPTLAIEIVRSQIRDQSGNVVREVG